MIRKLSSDDGRFSTLATAFPSPDPVAIPSIGLLNTVANAADLGTVMELVGWTNDRLVADRISRLPQTVGVCGSPNANIVMAAFLHVAPGGMRFNGPELCAWYASDAGCVKTRLRIPKLLSTNSD
jgi:hypothetical protein